MASIDRGRRARFVAYLVIAALLLVLVAVTTLPIGQPSDRPFDFDSTGPMGLAALRLWLQEMGYTVTDLWGERFAAPAGADLLLVFPGQTPFTKADAELLHTWVENGGTLALVAAHDPALEAVFGKAKGDYAIADQLVQIQPLLPDQPAETVDLEGGGTLDLSEGSSLVSVMELDGGAVTLAVQKIGRGLVWRLASYHLLTNDQLREDRHAAVVIALLRTVAPGGAVAFDAYHLFGPQAATAPITTLQDWLYRTPLGWATFSILIVLAIFWLLQGRRLGPALPTVHEVRRREAAEYIQAMANLQRRAHVQPMIGEHHKRRIKVALGRPLHLNPDLPTDEFVDRLAATHPQMDAARLKHLSQLLCTLDKPDSEQALIKAVAAGDDLLRSMGVGR